MGEEKKGSQEIDFVKWFSEVGKDDGKTVGGKGANLSEIYSVEGIPVPAGFVVTAQAYDYFIEKAEIDDEIKELLGKINYEDTKQLDETTKQIREHILKASYPKEMEEEILEAYENLDVKDFGSKGAAHDILKTSAEPVFVAVRSSATTEDLAEASFAGQQDSFVNVKGNTQLLEHVKKCFASLFTSRATYYRNKQGFKHEEASLAVVVQDMVDSDKSGVIFSKDPARKNEDVILEAVFGLGEGIVSGRITPDNYIVSRELKILKTKIANKKIAITRDSGGKKEVVKLREEKANSPALKDHEVKKLAEMAIQLEEHFKKPQDIEFAIEGDEIFIVQTRPITTMEKRFDDQKAIKGEPILSGLAASPGIASGKIRIINDLADLHKIQQGDVLVTEMTNPDMVVSMQKSAAIVTDEGGRTAHAAIVSREMGIPAIVGTGDATTKLKEGEIITVDGYTGKVYKGKVGETKQKEVLPVTAKTKTNVKVIVDLPSFAERASKTKLNKVGLTRIEGIIAESGKHPNHFILNKKPEEYEEIIYKGINDIAKYFDEMWIRTSDIRSDEYANLEGAPKEKEANPMLGMHGIRYSLKHPEIMKAEMKALKRVAAKNKKMGLLLPQVISVEEVKGVKKLLAEIDFKDAKVGVMVETPAAVQIIRDLCEEGIDFISFGTNDLTQYMLAVDRGNGQVQHLYNETHPAILYQLGYVIRVCKRNKVETSICGQAGSKKEMVQYLVESGIDSITVNADMAAEIANHIYEVEQGLVKGTDKEPRKYQPGEKEGEGGAQAVEEGEGKEEDKGIVSQVVEKVGDIAEDVVDKVKNIAGGSEGEKKEEVKEEEKVEEEVPTPSLEEKEEMKEEATPEVEEESPVEEEEKVEEESEVKEEENVEEEEKDVKEKKVEEESPVEGEEKVEEESSEKVEEKVEEEEKDVKEEKVGEESPVEEEEKVEEESEVKEEEKVEEEKDVKEEKVEESKDFQEGRGLAEPPLEGEDEPEEKVEEEIVEEDKENAEVEKVWDKELESGEQDKGEEKTDKEVEKKEEEVKQEIKELEEEVEEKESEIMREVEEEARENEERRSGGKKKDEGFIHSVVEKVEEVAEEVVEKAEEVVEKVEDFFKGDKRGEVALGGTDGLEKKEEQIEQIEKEKQAPVQGHIEGNINTPLGNTGQSNSAASGDFASGQASPEQIQKDIVNIEKEKQEYLQQHPEGGSTTAPQAQVNQTQQAPSPTAPQTPTQEPAANPADEQSPIREPVPSPAPQQPSVPQAQAQVNQTQQAPSPTAPQTPTQEPAANPAAEQSPIREPVPSPAPQQPSVPQPQTQVNQTQQAPSPASAAQPPVQSSPPVPSPAPQQNIVEHDYTEDDVSGQQGANSSNLSKEPEFKGGNVNQSGEKKKQDENEVLDIF